MNSETFSRANNQLDELMQPVRKVQGVFIKHAERIADYHVHALQHISETGVQYLRLMQDVGDPQTFMTKNAELMKSLNEKMSKNINNFAEIQRDFSQDLQEVGRESAEKATQMAERTAEEASRGMRDMAEKGAEATEQAASSASSSAQGSERESSERGSSERESSEQRGGASSRSSEKTSEKASASASSGKRSA